MSTLGIAQDFSGNDWRKRTAGSGAVSITGGVARCTGQGDGVAVLEYYIPVTPGMMVSVDVFARALSGSGVIELARLAVDGSNWTDADVVTVKGSAMRPYHLTAVVPYQTSARPFIRLTLGVGTTVVGDLEFTFPTIRVDGGFGHRLVLARGLVRVENGVASLNPTFLNQGVKATTRIDTISCRVDLQHPYPATPESVRPLIQATGTNDTKWIPVVGTVVGGATPSFRLNWVDGTQYINIQDNNVYAFFEVSY